MKQTNAIDNDKSLGGYSIMGEIYENLIIAILQY